MKLSLLDNGTWDLMDSWNDILTTNGRHQSPDSYWSELDDAYSCKVNMAGIKKDNIKVLVEGRLLRVSAEQDGHKYDSSAYIPKKANTEASSVRYEDGMLYLEFKKSDGHKSIELEIS